ncbi:copper amine oxidase N-terminal domain-containing protein [Paenibacillus typhae]|uniref:Copper amine oxidase N-terminal domain-containing protein n=1 Tax=Paenibacillus typhae TaxID=1174501 RepID=A0A1G8RRG2_9BACL|nr:copper amine oxidase N-terminal domain-containing protein [Paenibacillus typhae]SDJ19085.1 Copper amine oxidase N-terminal domain-containing protein [Paenibacillus typhae]
MSKVKLPAAALLLILLTGAAPLTATAPISASAVTVSATAAAAEDTIKVQSMDVKMVFDGVSMQPPTGQHVFIYNNTTYVPIRFVSYALQKSVSWDAKNLKVTVAEPSSTELVVIKEYLMNAGNTSTIATTIKSISLNKVKASYVFNGSAKAVPSGQDSYMLNGSLYVPLRFLSESVGNKITWDQKTKTITAISAGYQEQNSGSTSSGATGGANPYATATPAPTSGASTGGGSAESGKVTYEQITSETEAKLTALRNQSSSVLVSLVFQYVQATDQATKSSLLAQGKQQLASSTSSFNSIVADAEKQLTANGYSTDIINQYRATFEAELQEGMKLAESLAN